MLYMHQDQEITFEDNFPAASQFLPPLLHITGADQIKTYLYDLYMQLNHFLKARKKETFI